MRDALELIRADPGSFLILFVEFAVAGGAAIVLWLLVLRWARGLVGGDTVARYYYLGRDQHPDEARADLLRQMGDRLPGIHTRRRNLIKQRKVTNHAQTAREATSVPRTRRAPLARRLSRMRQAHLDQ